MTVLLIPIFFAAFLTLGVTGFGHALLAMPLLSPLLGVSTAAPLVALASLTGEAIMLLRYRRQVDVRAVWRLVVASVLAIPLGVAAARLLDGRLVLALLGVVAAGYGSYALIGPRLPHLRHPNWAFPFGFLGGLLSGAYNTGGPPVVIYGNLARWDAAAFKSSLQGMFLLNSMLIVSSHALLGNLTPAILTDYLIALPAIGAGLWAGWRLERRVNPQTFRRIVLVLLIVLGVRLMVTSLFPA